MEKGLAELFVCLLYFKNSSVRFLVVPTTPLILYWDVRVETGSPGRQSWYCFIESTSAYFASPFKAGICRSVGYFESMCVAQA